MMDDTLRVVGRAEIFNGAGVIRMKANRRAYFPGEEIVGKVSFLQIRWYQVSSDN
jgi:hypothetical protein